MKRIIWAVVVFLLIGVIVASAIVFLKNGSKEAQPVTTDSTFEQVKKLSEGSKPACLTNNDQAVAIVRSQDKITTDNNGVEYSNFDMVLATRIYDVPAGTHFERTVSEYDGSTAKGALIYDSGYGSYNYSVNKLPGEGEWKTDSIIACM